MDDIHCICCNNIMEHFLILSESNSINVCDNCFHLQKSEMLKDDCMKLSHYNETMFMKFIFKSIDNFKSDSKIKILNINDNDTNLLDTLFTNIINFTRIPKTYVNTVSLSLNFRPSYFSKHKCYRDIISEKSIKNLKSNYNSFDMIILNTTLLTCKDSNEILTMCKELCNINTNIFVINYHSMDPIDYLTIDKRVKNLFTTNSLKRLCTNNDFELDDLYIENNYVFYKIISDKKDKVSQNIVSTLYDEMDIGIYRIDRYNNINRNWYNKLFESNKLLDRYKLNKYNLVYISQCRCCIGEVYNNNKFNYKINDLTKLSNILKDDNKYVFIIFNLNNQIVNDLQDNLKRNLKNDIKCLIYDIKNLITHPINYAIKN
jgi:hypothetical protein